MSSTKSKDDEIVYPTVKCLDYSDNTIHLHVPGQATCAAFQASLHKVGGFRMGTISITSGTIINNINQIASVTSDEGF